MQDCIRLSVARMKFTDFAIDLAAVLSASRSVASKHVALRRRQFDIYRRPPQSGSPGTNHEAASTVTERFTAASVYADNSRMASPNAEATENDTTTGRSLNVQNDKGNVNNRQGLTPETPSDLFSKALLAASNGASGPNLDNANRDSDVPAGVYDNVFYTKHGSHFLDPSKRQSAFQDSRRGSKSKPPGEHPLRHWPRTLGSTTGLTEGEANTDQSAPLEFPARPRAQGVHSPAKSYLRSETSEGANVQPSSQTTLEVNEKASVYALRESKVPASRFSRLWNYGGLAAGMLGGAMSESIGRAFGSGGQGSAMLSDKNMERLVTKLSRMRGAALKLGQQLSFQDSKMLPAPIQAVLQRVQDRADYMPAWQRDRVLTANLGIEWRELYSDFEERPIAAASIGQVHKAVLKSNGKPVAVKIQFPGVAESINSDLDNLGMLLTATKLLPKGLYLNKTIDNARVELAWECDYEREADCGRRYKSLLADEPNTFVVPDVYPEASGKQVLTMDFLEGTGVTRITSFSQEQRDWIGTQLLRLCLREITEFKFMQTDPNWTNFLYNDTSKRLELLDFGASREYPEKFVSQYVRLLEAASRSDRAEVKTLSENLGYLTGHESKIMLDAHVDSVLTLAEPFLQSAPEVYDFQDQTITERVKALIPVMLRERLAPPPEETYSLHRKLSGAFLLCSRLGSKVRCREMFRDSVKKSGYLAQ